MSSPELLLAELFISCRLIKTSDDRCSAPCPPSPDETDQHAVVTLLITLCPCDLNGHDL